MLRLAMVQTRRNLAQVGECALASGMVHVGLVALVVLATRSANGLPEATRNVVPLFLIPLDHTPELPRESRLPAFSPFGNEHSTGTMIVRSGPEGADLFPGGSGSGRRGIGGDSGMLIPGIRGARVDSVFSIMSVDSAVRRYPESAAPVYPQELIDRAVEGEVFAEFVVDTTGSVDTTSIRIKTSTHPEFAASVLEALPRMQFYPAIRNLRRVRQRVEQHFRFKIQPPDSQVS
jgi:TonB family protein